ncbi:trypsin-like serine peptidase [Streptomyces coeruleoprunus]|uniref:Trypsin-like serine peptidase n=1 Tax=Streptomyces coeruleoprunus TaxID=285563 RepID=A0ABV9XKJ3_9ACTN
MHRSRTQRKRPAAWAAVAVVVLATATACASPSHSATHGRGHREPVAEQAPPGPQRSAVPFGGLPAVGVLLDGDEHWCTASVVDSPKGNVVATAAHCVFEYGSAATDFTFAPAFRGPGGQKPYGAWKVRAVQVDEAWKADADDAHDFAFLTLEPDSRGRQVQDVVGGLRAQWDSGPERRVTVVGYPNRDNNPEDRAVVCTTDTARDEGVKGSMRMECGGFFDGTSGSPWLADYRDAKRPGRMIAVLSGGETDTESTAVLFGRDARALYERAVAAGS